MRSWPLYSFTQADGAAPLRRIAGAYTPRLTVNLP